MIIKGSALSGQIRSPDPAIWCVLVFGDDDGVVSDTADQIAAGWSKSAGGQANVLTLDDDDVRRDPALLFNKIETSSLLGKSTSFGSGPREKRSPNRSWTWLSRPMPLEHHSPTSSLC